MEKWKANNASHFPTPPTTAAGRYLPLPLRYTNNLTGTKDRARQCSYNKINGAYACGNKTALTDILRNEVGFKGFVTSDWGAITRAAGRILQQMEKFGLLDAKQQHRPNRNNYRSNAAIIEKTAEDAAVLLKNEGDALPLTKNDLSSLVLIGPGAGQTIAVGQAGEKAVGLSAREIGTLDVLKRYLGGSGDRINYAVADDLTGTTVPAQYLSHGRQPGLQRMGANGTAEATDRKIDFTLANGKALPANSSRRWSGVLIAPTSGTYRLNLQLLGCYGAMWVDGERLISNGKMIIHGDVTQAGQDDVTPTLDGLDNLRVAVPLAAGEHKLTIAVIPDTSNKPTQVRLNWVTPEQMKANYDAAITGAKHAKTAVVFAWSRGLPVFALPGDQNKLIADVAAVNPNTIVVLNVSQPVAMPWLSKVKAVLQMWWPGDEGGWATARLLLGRTNPGGRLPFTWANKLEDYPATDPNHPERSARGINGETVFSEGIYVGYRWFDHQKIEPLFPFGYGLSYSRFRYSDLKISSANDGGLNVSFVLKNLGSMAGDEVPQVYLGAPENLPPGAQFAVRALAAFDRIKLEPGSSKSVSLHVPLRCLEYWSTAEKKWKLALGAREVFVGSSSRDTKLEVSIPIHEFANAQRR